MPLAPDASSNCTAGHLPASKVGCVVVGVSWNSKQTAVLSSDRAGINKCVNEHSWLLSCDLNSACVFLIYECSLFVAMAGGYLSGSKGK
jgi:hypothetical protein